MDSSDSSITDQRLYSIGLVNNCTLNEDGSTIKSYILVESLSADSKVTEVRLEVPYLSPDKYIEARDLLRDFSEVLND